MFQKEVSAKKKKKKIGLRSLIVDRNALDTAQLKSLDIENSLG